MANLRVHRKNGNYNEELRKQIENDLYSVEVSINELEEKKTGLQKDLLELDIAPFKIGDYVMCDVPSGRSFKTQKCQLECVRGMLYVRPVSEDGKLSQRHFSFILPASKTYQDYFKKVED